MNVDIPLFLTLVAAVSSVVGVGLYVRGKVEDTARQVAEHTKADQLTFTSILDRLARIETKIDLLVENK